MRKRAPTSTPLKRLHSVALRGRQVQHLAVLGHILGADAGLHHAASATTKHAAHPTATTLAAIISARVSTAIARLTPAATASVTSSPTT